MRATALIFILLASLGASTPMVGIDGSCVSGDYLRWNGSSIVCTSPISSGQITFVISGSCPTGWTEVSALNGVMLRGTLAANGNVGTTGGSDTYTPAGSVAAPTLSGATATESAHTHGVTSNVSVADHASHTHTYTDVPNHLHTLATGTTSTGNFSQVLGTIDTSSGGTGATPTQTALGTLSGNPTAGVATGTTAGPNAALTHTVTNNAVTSAAGSAHSHTIGTLAAGAPAFTGTQATVVPAFVRVIFCQRA